MWLLLLNNKQPARNEEIKLILENIKNDLDQNNKNI